MQDRVPAERDSSSPDEHDLIWLHGAPDEEWDG